MMHRSTDARSRQLDLYPEVAPSDATLPNEDIAAIAKALGHPARIQIVRLLHEKRSCIGCDIVDEVRLAQSTVSEHLRILKAAGIIIGDIDRPRICYSLSPESLAPLVHLLSAVIQEPQAGEGGGSSCCASGSDAVADTAQ